MSELKTLKDLKKFEPKDKHYPERPIMVRFICTDNDELRAEAVKWYHRSDGNKHKFIMEFFNLTDDDVKHEKSEVDDEN